MNLKRIECWHVYRAVSAFNLAVEWFVQTDPSCPSFNAWIGRKPPGKLIHDWLGIATREAIQPCADWIADGIRKPGGSPGDIRTILDGLDILQSYKIIARRPGELCWFHRMIDGSLGREEISVWLAPRGGTMTKQDHPPIVKLDRGVYDQGALFDLPAPVDPKNRASYAVLGVAR